MRVSLIVATTVDGKITTTDDASSQFASEKDLEHLLAVRSQQDAILAGAKTILNDDPTFTSRPVYQRQRRKNGFSPNPIKCVVSGRGSILPSAKMFHHNNSPAIVFTTQQITCDRYKALSKIADVFVVGTEKVDFYKIVQILADNYQVESLLIEGGGEINASVFEAGIVNWTLDSTARAVIPRYSAELSSTFSFPSPLPPLPSLVISPICCSHPFSCRYILI